MKKKYLEILTILLAIVAIIIGALVLFRLNSIQSGEAVIIEKDYSDEKLLRVEVNGAVVAPGIYEFEFGSIVNDAIEKAGGLTIEADNVFIEKNINKAGKLEDGQKIYIPKLNEQDGGKVQGDSSTSGKININTASKEELGTLPGIGDAFAQRIIDARPFSSIEEIKEVKGIGDATYEKLKDKIEI